MNNSDDHFNEWCRYSRGADVFMYDDNLYIKDETNIHKVLKKASK